MSLNYLGSAARQRPVVDRGPVQRPAEVASSTAQRQPVEEPATTQALPKARSSPGRRFLTILCVILCSLYC